MGSTAVTERETSQTTSRTIDHNTEELTDFDALTGRYQRELMAHCYRMSGSVHEAEDLVQETFLRAWKASASFQGRSSVRTWLYKIATNVCLRAGHCPPGWAPRTPPSVTRSRRTPRSRGSSRCRTPPSRSPSATRSGWRSSQPCSTCRRASGRC